ncbi:hypothetical protein [Streptomyces cyaneofuscatus]|uniref:hypothetical protein n=1 Tax=Streptomyces cyaneofuscatus TaxID=66883 RepID=UPI0036CD0236
MSVVLAERWGGPRASEAVAETLARAQALAVRQHSGAVGADHLLGALLGTAEDPATHAGAVLRSLGRDLGELNSGSPGRPAAPVRFTASRRATLPWPEDAAAHLLRGLGAWTSATADEEVTTLHLLAALAGSDTPEGAFLRQNRLTSDLVLAVGARCREQVRGDDAAFSRDRAADEPAGTAFSVPDAPTPDDLRTRTSGRGSPTMTRVMGASLPRGTRVNTRLGVVALRWWAISHSANYLVALGAALMFADQALRAGPWWLLFCALAATLRLPAVPWGVWLTTKAVCLWAAPLPLAWAVLGSAVLELTQFRIELWAMRVDRGDPALPAGYFWRAHWREVYATALDRSGADRDDH